MITYIPNVVFHMRVRDDSIEGSNPYRWKQVSSFELFENKNILAFSLPGAFTPTCSTYQVPRFEELYNKFRELGIDDVYCISVNDAFVMNAWAKKNGIENLKMIPDGSGDFTRRMGMLVDKDNTWYDTGQALGSQRSAGYFSQVFRFPVQAGYEVNTADAISLVTISNAGSGYANATYS